MLSRCIEFIEIISPSLQNLVVDSARFSQNSGTRASFYKNEEVWLKSSFHFINSAYTFCLKKFSIRNKTFMLKIESWNFKICWKKNSWNLAKFQLNETTDRKNRNDHCLNQLYKLKFCEISQNLILNRCPQDRSKRWR